MKKRTNFDFSNHTHRVEVFTSPSGNEIRVDHLQRGTSRYGYVKFINDDEGLSVFGDFGNWIFCRPFVPSPDGYVSDHYWGEKLRIASVQDPSRYDAEGTRKQIEALINGGLEEWGYDAEELEKSKEWLSDLIDYADDELDYTYHAFRGWNPPGMDYEDIPFCKKGSIQLNIVFDAFEEICARMKVTATSTLIEQS